MKTPTPTSTSQFLTTQELASRWNVHKITIRRWLADHKITATRFGRGIRFSMAEVDRVERESTIEG
jgi:excisionase family DNA binding protein